MKREGNYEKGKKNGIWKEYYESGILQNEIEYKNDNQTGFRKE